jgi:hypothetical protein
MPHADHPGLVNEHFALIRAYVRRSSVYQVHALLASLAHLPHHRIRKLSVFNACDNSHGMPEVMNWTAS